MTDKPIILMVVTGIAAVSISLYLSHSALFPMLLVGSLLIPPAFVFSLILIEGIPVIIKESQNLLASENRFLVISASKESIILEPRFR